MSRAIKGGVVLGLTLIFLLVGPVVMSQVEFNIEADLPPLPSGVGDEPGHDADVVLDLIDEANALITKTAIALGVGDSYIDRDNALYEVTRVEGGVAHVANRGQTEMPDVSDAMATSNFQTWLGDVLRGSRAQADKDSGVIGIYHTHSAESYEPTSGTAFKDRGDVFDVGLALKEALEAEGYTVVMSERGHLPHDGGAYQRSRRTAAELSREMPTTLIDVHRDAVPDPDFYRVTVDGKEMTAIRLVVGRQNQNRDANLEYAKRIKAIADEKYPGLIKGIFHAQGNYNQDLGPRMILLEFGTHTTTLEEAKESAGVFAKILPAAAGLAPGTKGAANEQIGGAATRTMWWILGIIAIGTLGWVWLNREGLGIDRLLGQGGGGDDHGGDQG